MEITLERNVTVQSYEALMEIASFDEKYDFILPVLQLEEEGGITVEQVNTKLLNERPNHQMGERLLDRIEQFRLIKKNVGVSMEQQSSLPGIYLPTERGGKLMEILRNRHYREIDSDLLKSLVNLGILYKHMFDSYSMSDIGNALVDNPWPQSNDRFDVNLFKSLESVGIVRNINSDPISDEENCCTLTELGEKALREGKVPVPEKGLYVLYTTEDPLFSEKMIAYEPKDERKGKQFQDLAFAKQNKKEVDHNNSKISDTPRWLKDLIKSLKSSPKIIGLPAQNGEEIQLVNVEGQVNRSNQTKNVSLVLRISSGQNPEMKVIASSGKNNSKSVCKPNMEMTVFEVLKQLVPERADDIIESEQEPAILISFDEIENKPSEIHSGKRNLKINKPTIEDLGRFKDVTVEGVPLLPKTLDDAIAWANSLVSGWIDYYIDESSYDSLCEKAITRFSERFDSNKIRNGIHSFEEMKRTLNAEKKQNPQKYWFVTTPEILTFREMK